MLTKEQLEKVWADCYDEKGKAPLYDIARAIESAVVEECVRMLRKEAMRVGDEYVRSDINLDADWLEENYFKK